MAARVGFRQRFEALVARIPFHPCWEWTGRPMSNGYGRIDRGGARARGATVSAHRAAWELYRGPIPTGFSVLHRCDNPLCVNPDHLFIGTALDNMRDKVAKGRSSFGERNGIARLTNVQVREIRSRRDAGERACDLAQEFGVERSAVWRIMTGRNWSRITGTA